VNVTRVIRLLSLSVTIVVLAGAAGPGVEVASAQAPAAASAQVPAATPGNRELERPFRILVERLEEQGSRSVTVYSDGVGFWKNARQFQVTPAALDAIRAALDESGFRTMPDMLGQGRKRLRSRVSVASPSLTKEVVQLLTGEQSTAFDKLTAAIVDVTEPLAKEGVSPTSLADGLAKVASGELAPAALGLVVQRQPELTQPQGPGWLLSIDYGEGSLQESLDRKRGEPRSLDLPADGVRRLAASLRDSGFAAWPSNLYSQEYVQIIVSVMRWRKVVEARAFTRLTPKTRPAEQKQLDELLVALEAWRREVPARPGRQ
jgi:hypothetical protein